jgi:hypothetical protein
MNERLDESKKSASHIYMIFLYLLEVHTTAHKKYCGAITRDGLSHHALKRKGGLDLAKSGLDLAGPLYK